VSGLLCSKANMRPSITSLFLKPFCRSPIIAFLSLLVFFPPVAFSEEIYRFERMWPTLPQPWYFDLPNGIAVDKEGNVFVTDRANQRIQKFTSDGQFLTRWSFGSRDDPLLSYEAHGIATDNLGNVYVVDEVERCIHKFTSDGRTIAKWGIGGQSATSFGIATDTAGNVYLVTRGSYGIDKFASDGTLLAKWESCGSDGALFRPYVANLITSSTLFSGTSCFTTSSTLNKIYLWRFYF